MTIDDGSAVSRQFVAHAPSMNSQALEFLTGKRKGVFYVLYIVVAVAIFAFTMYKPLRPWMPWGLGISIGIVVVGPLIWTGLLWSRSRRKTLIGLTGDGLTVNGLPGTVFSLVEAQLGPWVTMGVALHLQSGSHRFVLGGRDRRIAPTTRLDEQPVSSVDAWLWASDFDELLALAGGRAELRGPAPEGPIRCLLFPNPYLAEEVGSLAIRKQLRLQRSLTQPSLLLDVDAGAVRVTDPNSNSPTASASFAQMTVTPATFQPDSVSSGDGSTYDYPAIAGLVVGLPGAQPLTIGCLDMAGTQFRFSWRVNPPRTNQRPTYAISAGDLQALVEKFGLTPQLQDGATR